MKVIQFKILQGILSKIETPEYLWAFERDRRISDMAKVHVGKEVVLSFDIKNFFHSITQVQVEAIFKAIGLTGLASRVASEICTYKYYVPQGAITSPKVSNIVAGATFGPEIKDMCESLNVDLTIYADDITISAERRLTQSEMNTVMTTVRSSLNKYGFILNDRKTKVMSKNRRQWVCGTVVNEKVNLLKRDRLRLRAIVHNITKNGIESEAAKTGTQPDSFISKVRGQINWFVQLNPIKGRDLMHKLNTYLDSINYKAV